MLISALESLGWVRVAYLALIMALDLFMLAEWLRRHLRGRRMSTMFPATLMMSAVGLILPPWRASWKVQVTAWLVVILFHSLAGLVIPTWLASRAASKKRESSCSE